MSLRLVLATLRASEDPVSIDVLLRADLHARARVRKLIEQGYVEDAGEGRVRLTAWAKGQALQASQLHPHSKPSGVEAHG